MNINELNEYVDHELQWLRYYAHRDARLLVNLETDFYKLRPMGYVKQMMSLEDRCAPCFIRCDIEIKEGMDLSLLESVRPPRRGNLTPLEAMCIIFPEKKQGYIDRIHPGVNYSKVFTVTDKTSSRYWDPIKKEYPNKN